MRKGDVYWVVAFVPVVLWLFGILNMEPKAYFKLVGGTMFVVEVVGFVWIQLKEAWAETVVSCNSSDTD